VIEMDARAILALIRAYGDARAANERGSGSLWAALVFILETEEAARVDAARAESVGKGPPR